RHFFWFLGQSENRPRLNFRAIFRTIDPIQGPPAGEPPQLFLPRPPHVTIPEFHETILAIPAILPKPPPTRPDGMELRLRAHGRESSHDLYASYFPCPGGSGARHPGYVGRSAGGPDRRA